MSETVIVWFRQDLRLDDNPALLAASAQGNTVLPVFIFDKSERPLGAAAAWWRLQSLHKLNHQLTAKGAPLLTFEGDPLAVLQNLSQQTGATAIYWNRQYDPHAVARDTKIKDRLKPGIACESFNGALLFEPWEIKNKSGLPFKVFTPFWRNCVNEHRPAEPIAAPARLQGGDFQSGTLNHVSLDSLKAALPPQADLIEAQWTPGEQAALARLGAFIGGGLDGYADARDFPAQAVTSRLSPYLRWGEISPRRIRAAINAAKADNSISDKGAEKFMSELGWREFSYHLLFNTPTLPTDNLQPAFNAFPWQHDTAGLSAWQKGETGYPLVDAGMRELRRTGYMHNRVRMVTGSFLIKHLLIDWREGEKWFWDCLLDADPANNAASWQWVAGCGADAAPFFRIFNPILQGEKFDGKGEYVKTYIPELAALQGKQIFSPWALKKDVVSSTDFVLGRDYPAPIVEHEYARKRALDAFQQIRN